MSFEPMSCSNWKLRYYLNSVLYKCWVISEDIFNLVPRCKNEPTFQPNVQKLENDLVWRKEPNWKYLLRLSHIYK